MYFNILLFLITFCYGKSFGIIYHLNGESLLRLFSNHLYLYVHCWISLDTNGIQLAALDSVDRCARRLRRGVTGELHTPSPESGTSAQDVLPVGVLQNIFWRVSVWPMVKDGVTLNPTDSVEYLTPTFFPDDNVMEDTPQHTEMRRLTASPNDEGIDDPYFTETELQQAMNSFNPRKAPGPDGFTADICIAAINQNQVVPLLSDTEYEQLPPLFELENYESCMEAPGAVYCLTNLQLYTDSDSDLYTLIQEYSEHVLKHYNYTNIDRGVCVKRSCASYAKNAGLNINRDLTAVLEGCLNETVINKYNLMARINTMSCDKQMDGDKTQIDLLDYVVLGVFIILLVLTLIGSYCEIDLDGKNKVKQNRIIGKELLSCFSFSQNWKKLTVIEERDPRLNIFKCVHGVRSIVIYFIVYGHSLLLITSGFTSDPHNVEKSYESVLMRLSYSGTSMVQISFFISGILLTFFLQTFAANNVTWKTIPKLIFLRWWRLTPPAAAVIAFTASWLRHAGRGPLWSAVVTGGACAQCRRYFWAHLLYVNNYLNEISQCAFQTWYIAADMQLFIVGIIVHCAIRNRGRAVKVICLLSLLMLGAASAAATVWRRDMDGLSLLKPEAFRTLNDPAMRELHMQGHNNLQIYVMGMASGYWVHYLQQQKVEYPDSKVGNILCWCLIPLYAFVIYCSSLFINDGARPSLAVRMLFAALNKPVTGIIFVVWILGVTLKFNGMSKAVMEWRGWVLPSRLSYSVFLLHNIFIYLALGVRTRLVPVSFLNVFLVSIGVLVLSYLVAIPFYLLVEAPTSRLMKLMIDDKTDKKE